jgi:hypothetical protein
MYGEAVETGEDSHGEVQRCGNDYDKAFTVTAAGRTYTLDSLKCATYALELACLHCGCKIIGHGVEQGGTFYCCAHCAKQAGGNGLKDRA